MSMLWMSGGRTECFAPSSPRKQCEYHGQRPTDGARRGRLLWPAVAAMVRVVIPSYSQNRSKSGQPFTVYNVDVYWNGRSHSVERRYRDFHELHCDLRKSRRCLPDFPPKKVRNLSSKVVEERRHLLEAYLQAVASLPLLPRQLVHFLQLQTVDSVADDCLLDSETDESAAAVTHMPVIGLRADLMRSRSQLGPEERITSAIGTKGAGDCLPDVVIKSSLAAFYSLSLE